MSEPGSFGSQGGTGIHTVVFCLEDPASRLESVHNFRSNSRSCGGPLVSFWQKPESSLFNSSWTPASAGVMV
jgi:hypothetical protein